MDENLEILEQELKRLRPAAPSRALQARIEHELDATVGRRVAFPRRWLWIAALPVAAAIALVVLQFAPRADSPDATVAGPASSRADIAPAGTGEDSLKPVAAENLLVSARDEGLVTLDDGTQARREWRQYIDTITWRNPRSKASLSWSVPREEVLVVPIAFQ